MMHMSAHAGTGSGYRHFCAAGRPGWRAVLAVLAALAAGPGCSSDPDAELPLLPCGVEEQSLRGDMLRSYVHRGYDERGNHVLSEYDHDIDGTIDDRFVWQYGANGEITLASHGLGSNTLWEVAVEYGAGDRLESVTWTTSRSGAGRADYEYDSEQRIIERWDGDNDGVAEASVTYTYDAGGKLEGSVFSCAGEVEPRSVTTMIWGEGGRIERVESRRDGEVNAATQFTYDQDGLLEGWERTFGDMVVTSEAFDYDAAGNVKRSSHGATPALGQDPPSWRVTDIVYDTDGRALSAAESIDGEPASESTYLYECPEREDSPGRHVGAPASPLPRPPMGPRGGVGRDEILTYALSAGNRCL